VGAWNVTTGIRFSMYIKTTICIFYTLCVCVCVFACIVVLNGIIVWCQGRDGVGTL